MPLAPTVPPRHDLVPVVGCRGTAGAVQVGEVPLPVAVQAGLVVLDGRQVPAAPSVMGRVGPAGQGIDGHEAA